MIALKCPLKVSVFVHLMSGTQEICSELQTKMLGRWKSYTFFCLHEKWHFSFTEFYWGGGPIKNWERISLFYVKWMRLVKPPPFVNETIFDILVFFLLTCLAISKPDVPFEYFIDWFKVYLNFKKIHKTNVFHNDGQFK